MRFLVSLLAVVCLSSYAKASIVISFEDRTLFTGDSPVGGGQYYNGNDGSGRTNSDGWTSGGVRFSNSYTGDFLPDFDYWSGWAYSNVANATTAGFMNQYAALPGGGSTDTGAVAVGDNYAIAFGSGAYFDLPVNTALHSVRLTNGTYAGLAMQNGDSFSKKFGGATGDDPDFFRVALTGFDGLGGSGSLVGSVVVDLADFTFADNSQDYILNEWLNVELSSLSNARSVSLSFSSSDVGEFGINTPAYVAMDNLILTVVPEPTGFAMFACLAIYATATRSKRTGAV